MTEREAREIEDGWIYVPHPAALPGWYQVTEVERDGCWIGFDCGRGTPYVTRAHMLLRWSRNRPAGA